MWRIVRLNKKEEIGGLQTSFVCDAYRIEMARQKKMKWMVLSISDWLKSKIDKSQDKIMQ